METDGSAPSGAPGATPDLEIQSFRDSKGRWRVIFSKTFLQKLEAPTAFIFFARLASVAFLGLKCCQNTKSSTFGRAPAWAVRNPRGDGFLTPFRAPFLFTALKGKSQTNASQARWRGRTKERRNRGSKRLGTTGRATGCAATSTRITGFEK